MSARFLKEFVTAEEDFTSFLSYMPNPDYILESTGETLEVIRKMQNDPHIYSKLEELKSEILSRDWTITPADSSALQGKITNRIQTMLRDEVDLDNDLEELLTALEYGFAISEIIWQDEGGEWKPEGIKGRDQRRFTFKKDGTPVVTARGIVEELNQKKYDKKFIIFTPFALNENPYGSSLLLKCYWPWKFKTAGFKFWLTMLDRFGVPSILALFSTEEQDIEKIKERANLIAAELAKLDSNSSAALANVEKALTVQNKGASGDFKTFIELCNSEISKAITGSTLTSDTGDHGSYAQSEVHEDTKERKGKRIAKKLAKRLSHTLVAWITALNWGENTPPPKFSFDIEEVPGFDTIETAITLGIPVSRRALYTTYNLPEPESEEDIFVKEPEPQLELADSSGNTFFLRPPGTGIQRSRHLKRSSRGRLAKERILCKEL